jgi:hypothetical protein
MMGAVGEPAKAGAATRIAVVAARILVVIFIRTPAVKVIGRGLNGRLFRHWIPEK